MKKTFAVLLLVLLALFLGIAYADNRATISIIVKHPSVNIVPFAYFGGPVPSAFQVFPKMSLLGDCPTLGGWAPDARPNTIMENIGTGQYKIDITYNPYTTPNSCEVKPVVLLFNISTGLYPGGHVASLGAAFKIRLPNRNSTLELFPHFYTYTGQLEFFNDVVSPQLGNSRRLYMYKPPAYVENLFKSNFKVLILNDGDDAFESTPALKQALDTLYLRGDVEDIVFLGIASPGDARTTELTPYKNADNDGGKLDLYLDFVLNTAIPYVQNSRLNTSKVGIAGFSLGGLASCYAAYTRSNIFDRALCMSSAFWWADYAIFTQLFQNLTAPTPAPETSFHLYAGTGDVWPDRGIDVPADANTAANAIQARGIDDVRVFINAGEFHQADSWINFVFYDLPKLYRKTAIRPTINN